MSYRLKSHSKCPPGEFQITIVHEGGTIRLGTRGEAGSKSYGPSPLFDDVVNQIRLFCDGNRISGWTIPRISELLDDYTCTRLAGLKIKSYWCQDTDRPYSEVAASPKARGATGGCGSCGARL